MFVLCQCTISYKRMFFFSAEICNSEMDFFSILNLSRKSVTKHMQFKKKYVF